MTGTVARVRRRVREGIRTLLAGPFFRPRWAWVCLLAGSTHMLLPDRPGALGCLDALLVLVFLAGLLPLAFLGLRWAWVRIVFRVSRRMWMILILLSLLPALSLTIFFLSLAWLGLGGQVCRTFQGNLKEMESSLRLAAQEPRDAWVLQSLWVHGEAKVAHVPQLPPNFQSGFVGLVRDTEDALDAERCLALRAVTPSAKGHRLLTLHLSKLARGGKELWGGRMHFRLDWVQAEDPERGAHLVTRDEEVRIQSPMRYLNRQAPVLEFSMGEVLNGSGIFKPFRLPPLALPLVDWQTGRPMLLTVTPETSLKELFAGYGYGEKNGNLSGDALLAIAAVSAAILFLALVQFVALVMGLLLARSLGASVDSLFRGVVRLTGGDFSVRIRPRRKDQVGALARAFNDMAQRLQEAQQEQEVRLRLEEELRVARDVQMRLLPDLASLRLPASVQAAILPAREVAGDYYDVFRLAGGRIAFLIADVSGKGTSAAFYAAETKGVVAALDKERLGPRDVVDRLNQIWMATHPRNVFLTLVYGTFDPADGSYAFVRAGHTPAYLRREVDGVRQAERLLPPGLGIGMNLDRFLDHLALCEGRLEEGEALVFFTDGLIEARDAEGAFFGEEGVVRALARPGGNAQALVLSEIAAFLDGQPLEDDLTLLVLTRAQLPEFGEALAVQPLEADAGAGGQGSR